MPFPLAHPAAVLPFKRFCPRWLNLPALVIGSMIPDVAYVFGRLKIDELSHSALGIGLFSLPVGVLLTYLYFWIGSRSIAPRFEKFRLQFPAYAWPSGVPLFNVAVSVSIGAATHLAWDAFTHSGGSAAGRWPLLNESIGSFAGHNVRICRLLWYLSSFIGVACVYLVFQTAQNRARFAEPSPIAGQPRSKRIPDIAEFVEALVVAALVLPIELLHDLVRGPIGLSLVGALTLLVVAAIVWISSRRKVPLAPVSKETGTHA